MPPVVSAIAIGLAGGIGPATLFQTAFAKFLVGTAMNVAFSFVSGALTKKDRPDSSSFSSIKSAGATQQFRQAITERRMVYGEQRVSGPIVFPRVSDNNKYLHFVTVLASHEIEEIGEILLDEEPITPDMINGSGMVTSGRYANLVRIKKYLGTPDQSADPDLVAEIPEWTTAHRLRHMAYIYVRYQWNRDKFPTGIPQMSAWVKGKKCFDPRDSVTRWTPNVALITRDYLADTRLGLRVDDAFIDDDITQASANTCEEYVTTNDLNFAFTSVDTTNNIIRLSGDRLSLQTADKVIMTSGTVGGLVINTEYYVIPYQRRKSPRIKLAATMEDAIAGIAIDLTSSSSGNIRKIAEPRYFGGGVIKTSAERGANIEEILTGMAGQCVYSGGSWRILAGEYQTPTIYYDQDDVVGPIRVSTKVSKAERFNRVQGVYISPLNDGNPADYPLVSNLTYTEQDGEEIKRNLDLGFTQRPHSAQRIAKIALERMRQEIIIELTLNLNGMKVQVGDNFYFTFPRYGWENKVFEVIDWSLSSQNDAPIVSIKARENASQVYDWNNGEETTVDPAPNTNLPDPFTVEVVIGFGLDSIAVETNGGDILYKVIATWDISQNFFVQSGGHYELFYRKSVDVDFASVGIFDGNVGKAEIPQLQRDTLYDFKIVAYNSLGVSSADNIIYNFQLGTSVAAITEDWENETLPRDGDDWENETLTTEDWET